jgi:hypothetical protein
MKHDDNGYLCKIDVIKIPINKFAYVFSNVQQYITGLIRDDKGYDEIIDLMNSLKNDITEMIVPNYSIVKNVSNNSIELTIHKI